MFWAKPSSASVCETINFSSTLPSSSKALHNNYNAITRCVGSRQVNGFIRAQRNDSGESGGVNKPHSVGRKVSSGGHQERIRGTVLYDDDEDYPRNSSSAHGWKTAAARMIDASWRRPAVGRCDCSASAAHCEYTYGVGDGGCPGRPRTTHMHAHSHSHSHGLSIAIVSITDSHHSHVAGRTRQYRQTDMQKN